MTAFKTQTVRRSVIAGQWYPGTEQELARTIDEFLSRVDQPLLEGELLGLISPHAGYAYSGQTAAHAYHQLQGQNVSTVVIIGLSHRAWLGNYAVSAEEAYETPLGRVPLAEPFIHSLASRIPLQRVRRDAEHSLEIQLPFLQRQLGEFQLVPIMLNADDPAAALSLATSLAATIRERTAEPAGGRILLVASSDLHHIENYDEVVRRDGPVVEALAAYDLQTLTQVLMAPGCSVCGRMSILAVLHAARELGADAVKVLHHTNSGDVTGQRWPGQYTVGYLAAAIYRS